MEKNSSGILTMWSYHQSRSPKRIKTARKHLDFFVLSASLCNVYAVHVYVCWLNLAPFDMFHILMSNLASRQDNQDMAKVLSHWASWGQPDAASPAALVDRSSCPGESLRRQHQPGAKGIAMLCTVHGFFMFFSSCFWGNFLKMSPKCSQNAREI